MLLLFKYILYAARGFFFFMLKNQQYSGFVLQKHEFEVSDEL